MKPTVMLVGLGGLGSVLLELLAREEGLGRIVVGSGGVQPAPIDGLTLAEAIDINERSHPFDGIECIEADGTVIFCPEAAGVLRAELGYDCERFAPAESEERAKELMARFREYAERYGVHLENDVTL